ncbi:zinc finger, c4 type (two domains) domain-containing protein [Ditylenchus destructor]|uniref:Zinc finger, c4 type (Two domains) domain-containing protein n=1 Tax=Ditylenchus destructor TaxID=166010 RepID=A0AAD4QXK5_9BILA|nr:zinc finger, c4 type (two domains) domain-containing protein [Ditylenchus destructor]
MSSSKYSGSKHSPTCDICGDAALGNQYGCVICNGCKGFFRRSVLYEKTYQCRNENNCIISKENRKTCRACRYKKCLDMGMNPRCVQTETALGHKSSKNKESKENKQNSPSPSEIPKHIHSTIPPTTSNTDIMALCSEYDKSCTIGIQTEDSGYIKDMLPYDMGYSHQVPVMNHYDSLMPNQVEMLAKSFVNLERIAFERVDEPIYSQSQALENPFNSSKCPFYVVFDNPTLIIRRFKITPTGSRMAQSVMDPIECWKRLFVYFVDFIKSIPEVNRLQYQDLVNLTEGRYIAFRSWTCANWTVKAGCEGTCFCNRTYFPRDPAKQCILDQKKYTERLMQILVAPLKELKLSEEERVIFTIIMIFSQAVPGLSQEGEAMICQIRNYYLNILNSYIMHNYSITTYNEWDDDDLEPDVYAAIRVGTLLSLLSAITELVHLTTDNVKLIDVLQLAPRMSTTYAEALSTTYDKATQ